MALNEEGEWELVLGNKQLMSVMFILVVLLGVFFTMGYIVGRNNPSQDKVLLAAKAQQANADRPEPLTVSPSPGTKSAAPLVMPEKPKPFSGDGTPEARKKEALREDPPAPVKPSAPTAVDGPASGLFTAAPSSGLYLQVAAIDRPGATGMAEAYRRQQFPALITNSSSPSLFRVIIGPYRSTEEIAAAKVRLEKIGVKGSILRKF